MKKALVILLALSMVFGAFADPDVTVSVTEFKGEAEFGWKADLEGETTGMYNKDSASLKIQFIDKEATRSTEGEGLWGELVIKAGDKVELEAGKDAWTIPSVKVDTAKIHFVDGDTYVRLNILKPGFAVGEIGYTIATDADSNKFASVEAAAEDYKGFTLEAGIPMVDVEVAFGDNGAQKSDDKEYAVKAAATLKPIDDLSVYAGFAYATAEEKAAIAANASYKLAINDTFFVKPTVAFTTKDDAKKLGFAVLFGWGADGLEPGFKKAADLAAALDEAIDNAIAAPKAALEAAAPGVLTGDYDYDNADADGQAAMEKAWVEERIGAIKDAAKKALEDQYYVSGYNVGNKCADGVSFATEIDLDNTDSFGIGINAYDSTLLAGFVPGLKVGAKYAASSDEFGKGDLAAALKYGNDFGILTVDADFAFGANLAEDEDNTAISYAVKLSTDDIIANTTLFAQYDATNASVFGESTKGAITLGAKISF